MATLPKVLINHADSKSAGGVALRVRTQAVLEKACMGRLKSSIEFRRSAPPSSSTWPVLRDMLSTDDLREARQQARIIALHPCIRRIQRIQTMMQSCASAAKLRSGGSILHCGLKAMLSLGAPPPRIVIGRPLSRPERASKAVWAICSGQALSLPDAGQRHAEPRPWSPCATAQSRGGQCCSSSIGFRADSVV